MKPISLKQFLAFALFACSLSADVPSRRESGVPAQPEARRGSRSVAGPAWACSFWLCDGHALSMAPVRASAAAIWDAPDFMAGALPALLSPDVDCARWEAPPRVSRESWDVPMDPIVTALFQPRSRMPLVLLECAWARPAGYWEQNQPLAMAGNSGRADAATMIARLKKVFEKENVPQQWVWIAEVESALNPRATSSAGAVGLFQLMPGTARRFGLRTGPEDDRMAPEKSAVAAAQYLKFLRREFGCWSLALAAYNAGEGRIKDIMKKRKARTFSEIERYLPAETQAYVPKVMAVVSLREDQRRGVPGAYWLP